MNAGLAQGFVKFQSVACVLLRAFHELGDMRHVDLVEETGLETRLVSTALRRLKQHKFIFKIDLARKYETGERTQQLFGLKPSTDKKMQHKRATEQERMARRRTNLKGQVASVFAFRGQINV